MKILGEKDCSFFIWNDGVAMDEMSDENLATREFEWSWDSEFSYSSEERLEIVEKKLETVGNKLDMAMELACKI